MFKKLVDALKTSDLATWIGHSFVGALITFIIGGLLVYHNVPLAWWLAASFNIGFWWGRERTHYEAYRIKDVGLRKVIASWYKGFFPFAWGLDGFFDLAFPAVTSIIIAAIMT